jgi:hypothetical protein
MDVIWSGRKYLAKIQCNEIFSLPTEINSRV